VVTENGCVDQVPGPGLPSPLNDTFRLQYLQGYLEAVRLAIVEDGVDVRGYFLWSLLDNVEWGDGLRDAFGLFRVDRASLTRTAKASVDWVSRYIRLWDAKRSSGLVELQ
jgi:beta-glucosidase